MRLSYFLLLFCIISDKLLKSIKNHYHIPFINNGIAYPVFELKTRPLLYMSAVVLEELAFSARRVGAFLVTLNLKDFLRIKEFLNFKML